MRSPIGQALGGVLKNAARQALPIAGRAIGGYVGGSTGAQVGAKAAAAAGATLRPRARRAQPGGQGVRIAKSFVRFAGATVRAAVTAKVRHRRWCSRNPQRLRPPPGTRPASFAVRRRRSRGAGSVAAATSSSSTAGPLAPQLSKEPPMHDIDRTQMELRPEMSGSRPSSSKRAKRWAGEGGRAQRGRRDASSPASCSGSPTKRSSISSSAT